MKLPSFAKLLPGLKRVGAAVIIIVLGFSGFNYLVSTKPDVPSRPRAEETRKVSVTIAESITASPMQKAFGTVKASRVSELRFAINGEVDSVDVAMRNGAIVKQGQILAQLDTELLELALKEVSVQLDAEKENNQELSTQRDLRERQFNRVNQMKAASVASEKRLDDAQLAFSIAKNALLQSNARIDQLVIAQKRAQRNLRDATLKAPFDGVLAGIIIGEGQVLTSNNPIGSITDLKSLEVSFIVPAEVYTDSAFLIGQKVAITWTAGGRDVITVMGEIERAEGNVQASEGGGRLYASLPNSDVDGLPPVPAGAFVEISYPSQQLENVIVLPESAVFDRNSVFVIKENRADRREIQVLSKSEGMIYIRGDINDGDQVITTRIPGLAQGTLVKVIGS